MQVAEAVGRALASLGVDAVFGLLGSGNLTVTNALRDAGVPFYAARHEGGAICMTDGYARVSGRLAACSVHQGPGLTNTTTGLTEAAKSRTPLRPCGPPPGPPSPDCPRRSGPWSSASMGRRPRWRTWRGRCGGRRSSGVRWC